MNIGQPSSISALSISGYACQPSTLGQLNSYIGTCFQGSGYSGAGSFNYDVCPPLGQEELAVMGYMYLVSYYTTLANLTMGGGGDSIPYVQLSEGDSKITRGNPAAIGAVYFQQARQKQYELQMLANQYVLVTAGGSIPRSVDMLNIVPAVWSYGFIGP